MLPRAGHPIVHPTEKFDRVRRAVGDYGPMSNIRSPEYDTLFQQAGGLINTACDEFKPEG